MEFSFAVVKFTSRSRNIFGIRERVVTDLSDLEKTRRQITINSSNVGLRFPNIN